MTTASRADGRLTTDRGGVEQAKAVAIQADDKIVVAGISGPPGDFNWAIARYRALDGSPDTTWSPDGWRETDFGAAQEYANDVAIQPDGKIVVAGQTGTAFALARYNTDGTLDSSFSGDGKQTTSFAGQSDIATGRRDPGGRPDRRRGPLLRRRRGGPRLRARPLQPGRHARHELLGRRQADGWTSAPTTSPRASRSSPTAGSCWPATRISVALDTGFAIARFEGGARAGQRRRRRA